MRWPSLKAPSALTLTRLATAAAAALLLASSAAAWVGARILGDREQPGFEYMPDMGTSVPYDSFAPNPTTRDGKTLQAPVPGTIARGATPFLYEATAADAERAGRELTNPRALTPEALAQGRALYVTFCAVCHGEHGAGDGPLVPRIPNPPAYTSERVKAMPAGQLFHVITRGSGRMPSYAAQVTAEQRWLLVHYVQTLQQGGRP
ncbi:MAG TPA: cytochrome c [Vicinamibacteria bacterium]